MTQLSTRKGPIMADHSKVRTIRNFWIDADIDGRAAPFASGPADKDGGFDMRILVRNNGAPVQALYIYGIVDPNDPDKLLVGVSTDLPSNLSRDGTDFEISVTR